MTYQRPTDEQMPAALAEVMGWGIDFNAEYLWYTIPGTRIPNGYDSVSFQPTKSRDCSRIAVERCAELGLMLHYRGCLIDETQAWDGEWQYLSEKKLLLATPAQESYAAHRTLWEHRQQKGKP